MLSPSAPNAAYRWLPDRQEFLLPWAPASGWRTLDGADRTVSCVIPCRNQRRYLSLLLPQICDVLTETGLPWDVLVVDAASDDGSVSLLRHWSEMPGVRVALSREPVHRAEAIITGLRASRGDATIVLDANARYRMVLLQQAVARWLAGAEIAFATHTGGDRIVTPEQAAAAGLTNEAVIDTCDFDMAVGGMVLMDKAFVQQFLAELPPAR